MEHVLEHGTTRRKWGRNEVRKMDTGAWGKCYRDLPPILLSEIKKGVLWLLILSLNGAKLISFPPTKLGTSLEHDDT